MSNKQDQQRLEQALSGALSRGLRSMDATVAEKAVMAGVTQNTIYNWQHGDTRPSGAQLLMLMRRSEGSMRQQMRDLVRLVLPEMEHVGDLPAEQTP